VISAYKRDDILQLPAFFASIAATGCRRTRYQGSGASVRITCKQWIVECDEHYRRVAGAGFKSGRETRVLKPRLIHQPF